MEITKRKLVKGKRDPDEPSGHSYQAKKIPNIKKLFSEYDASLNNGQYQFIRI